MQLTDQCPVDKILGSIDGKVSPIRIAEGSGAKPEITGLTTVDAMASVKWMILEERHDEKVYLLVVPPVG
jgi:hypothetical protein